VKLGSSLVHRRTTCMQRLDALLELLGPGWVAAIGSDMTKTAFRFLALCRPHQVKRLGQARLGRWVARCSRGAWGQERAGEVLAAAEATLALWGDDGLDYVALADDIAVEARTALGLTEEIQELEERIAVLYQAADPDQLVRSAPGVGKVLAAQIRGCLGDPDRFSSLAAARSFSGLVPRHHASGTTDHHGGPTNQGDACLREALFMAADHARKVDPTLAARYQR
jgi:transposase